MTAWPRSPMTVVLAIEGIDTLYCNARAADVVTAWSGTDWSTASAGLIFDLENQQKAHPWEAFNGGGQLKFTIIDDAFGILAHRTAGAADSELVTGLDRDDTTVTVKDTSAFAASGHIFIGNETCSYASKNATQFLTVVRGKYNPIGCDPSGLGGSRFGYPHRVDTVAYAPPVGPRVTQFPVEWIGRWVTLYLHARESDGTLQTKANATRLFAGRIAELRDDPDSLGTVVVCDHALTMLAEAVVGADQFTGNIADGMFLPAGAKFNANDNNGTTQRTANALTVVTSGASGANQMNEGFYTHAQLHNTLNTWLASELAANRLHGTYVFCIDWAVLLTKIGWQIPGSAQFTNMAIGMPRAVARFMGFVATSLSNILGNASVTETKKGGEWHSASGVEVPLRSWVNNGLATIRLKLEDLSGAFQDQLASIPVNMKMGTDPNEDYGLFLVDDKILVRAQVINNGDNTFTLKDVDIFAQFGNGQEQLDELRAYSKRIDEDGRVTLKQIMIFEGSEESLLNQFVYSTGNGTAYNHDTYDTLPFGAGLGWPGGLFGDAWETSVANLPAATKPVAIVLDKPTKVSALLGSDLLLRFAFPVWRSGGLRMATWQTPTASLSMYSLTESNKAELADLTDVNYRTSTMLSDRLKSNQIKIRYNRSLFNDAYRSTINVEDRTTVDDGGSTRSPRTIDARNTYDEFAATGTAIEDIVPNVFLPTVTLFTRPMRTLRRSMSIDEFESLAPGDIVDVTDSFARDPDDGTRGITSRPAIVIGHRYQLSAPQNARLHFQGEVDLMFTRGNRVFAYGPCAEVDDTQSAGGFDAGYNSSTRELWTYDHKHSESSEAIDASHYGAGYVCEIVEIDPSNPASVTSWTRTVESISGNKIKFTATLSSPAWDATKKYRIIFTDYDSSTPGQQAKAYQADTDGLIQNLAQANTFGIATSSINATAFDHASLPERHAELTFGDGKSFDVGSLVGAQRMIDNLIDHKTALCQPLLGVVASNSTYSTGQGRKTVMVFPIALTTATYTNSVMRYVSIAPFLRSSDGTATSVRISLCDRPPMDTTVDDITIPVPNVSASWATSSTTWATGTPATLSLAVKDGFGWGWLIVECGYKSECRGIAKFVELERSVFV